MEIATDAFVLRDVRTLKSSDDVRSTAQTEQKEEQAIDTENDGRRDETLHRPHVRA